ESRRARQIVVDAPATLANGLGPRKIGIIGDGIDVGPGGQVRDVKPIAGEPLVETSSPARILPERLGAAPLLQRLRPAGSEQPSEEFEMDLLVLQPKLEVPGKGIGRPVNGRILV